MHTDVKSMGSVDNSIDVKMLQDSTGNAGEPKTALVYNSAGVACYYHRLGANPVQIALVTQTITGAHADGGFVELGAATMPGAYRLDLPDAATEDGVGEVVVSVTGCVPYTLRIKLDPRPQMPTGKVVTDGGNTATSFKTDSAETDTDAYKEGYLVFRTGSQQFEVKKITGYNGTTKFITVNDAFSGVPAADTKFTIICA